MKRIVTLLVLFFIIHNCSAQLFSKKRVLNNENFDKPSLSWGYFLGMNNYDYNFDYISNTYDIQTEKIFGLGHLSQETLVLAQCLNVLWGLKEYVKS